MTFHPRIDYAAFHKSQRDLEQEGEAFTYTPDNRARFDEVIKRYPPDRKRSAVLPALYLVQQQLGYVARSAGTYASAADAFTRAGWSVQPIGGLLLATAPHAGEGTC